MPNQVVAGSVSGCSPDQGYSQGSERMRTSLPCKTVHTVPMNGHLELLSIQEFYTVYSVTNDTEDKIILQ